MATKPKNPAPRRLTHAAIHKGVSDHHERIAAAVHRALKTAGLDVVTLHSFRLAMPAGVNGPCDPQCDPTTQKCVLDSNGGHVTWVCVPK